MESLSNHMGYKATSMMAEAFGGSIRHCDWRLQTIIKLTLLLATASCTSSISKYPNPGPVIFQVEFFNQISLGIFGQKSFPYCNPTYLRGFERNLRHKKAITLLLYRADIKVLKDALVC